MWLDNESGEFLFILGDSEVYNSKNTEPDWQCEDLETAEEWFDGYSTDYEE